MRLSILLVQEEPKTAYSSALDFLGYHKGEKKKLVVFTVTDTSKTPRL